MQDTIKQQLQTRLGLSEEQATKAAQIVMEIVQEKAGEKLGGVAGAGKALGGIGGLLGGK
ncbi:MAG: hypothetical protein RLO52_20310 [Sandaracinaceae bacterium]|nr:MAG: hypothetical protein EVA89_19130 [Sandaracinaceae bacterium]HBQ18329.1 hypothetical protein [Myxococcales bacterium]